MKRVLFLQAEYLDVDKKTSKAKEQEMRTALCQKAIKQFKSDMKKWLDDRTIRITKEYDLDEPKVIIEFADGLCQDIYEVLIKVDIVQTIDSILPKEAP